MMTIKNNVVVHSLFSCLIAGGMLGWVSNTHAAVHVGGVSGTQVLGRPLNVKSTLSGISADQLSQVRSSCLRARLIPQDLQGLEQLNRTQELKVVFEPNSRQGGALTLSSPMSVQDPVVRVELVSLCPLVAFEKEWTVLLNPASTGGLIDRAESLSSSSDIQGGVMHDFNVRNSDLLSSSRKAPKVVIQKEESTKIAGAVPASSLPALAQPFEKLQAPQKLSTTALHPEPQKNTEAHKNSVSSKSTVSASNSEKSAATSIKTTTAQNSGQLTGVQLPEKVANQSVANESVVQESIVHEPAVSEDKVAQAIPALEPNNLIQSQVRDASNSMNLSPQTQENDWRQTILGSPYVIVIGSMLVAALVSIAVMLFRRKKEHSPLGFRNPMNEPVVEPFRDFRVTVPPPEVAVEAPGFFNEALPEALVPEVLSEPMPEAAPVAEQAAERVSSSQLFQSFIGVPQENAGATKRYDFTDERPRFEGMPESHEPVDVALSLFNREECGQWSLPESYQELVAQRNVAIENRQKADSKVLRLSLTMIEFCFQTALQARELDQEGVDRILKVLASADLDNEEVITVRDAVPDLVASYVNEKLCELDTEDKRERMMTQLSLLSEYCKDTPLCFGSSVWEQFMFQVKNESVGAGA